MMVVVMVDAGGETVVKWIWFRSTSDTFLKRWRWRLLGFNVTEIGELPTIAIRVHESINLLQHVMSNQAE
ncbi:hypothetical protein Hanom_Chr01g00094721 [Helianthus anomalus]